MAVPFAAHMRDNLDRLPLGGERALLEARARMALAEERRSRCNSPRRGLGTKRVTALIITLALAACFTATSHARYIYPPGHAGSPGAVTLSFKRSFGPTHPDILGVVGGDIRGHLGGAVLQVAPSGFGDGFHEIESIMIVLADDPSLSFTMRVHGVQDITKRAAALNGRVIDGWLTGKRVHVAFRAVDCAEAPAGMCYRGTISVRRAGPAS